MKLLFKLKKLKNNSGFKKYFTNTSWVLGERIIRMTTLLFITIYIARYLGPNNFGLLSYTVSFVALFSAISHFGLDEILVRELVKTPQNRDTLLGTVFCLKIFGTLVMGLCIALVLLFTKSENHISFMVSIIALGFLFQTTNVIDFFFQAQVKSKYTVRAQFVQLVLTSILKIFLVWNKASLIWFAIALMLDQMITAILFLLVYNFKINKFPFFSFTWKKAKVLMRDAWPLIFSGMVVSIYMKIDQVMLKDILNNRAVAVYASAVKLCEAWYFVPTIITASLFPAIISARKKSTSIYQSRLQKLYDLMVWGSVLVALPTSIVAEWLIIFLYGYEFSQAAEVLRIYIWAGIFVSIGIASSKSLIAEKLEKYSLYRTILGAITNIGLNFWLIPIYGVKGAAYATLITQLIASFLILGFFKKTRNNFWIAANSLNPLSAFKRILK